MASVNKASHGANPPQGHINVAWFDAKRAKYSASSENETLRAIVREEIDALQLFYDRDVKSTAAEIARKITRPISTSPVPALGTYSDETVALITLWHVLREALVEWPSSYESDILNILSAIGQLPKSVQIHNGEATDAETGTQPLIWDTFPYFSFVWSESMPEPSTGRLSQEEYARQRVIEARLKATRVLH